MTSSGTLPDEWLYLNLEDVTSHVTDGTHMPPPRKNQGVPLLSAQDVADGHLRPAGSRFVDEEFFESELRRTKLAEGDVLLTIVGSIGRSTVVSTKPRFALQRSVAVLKPQKVTSRYLSYFLRSPIAFAFYQERARGTAQSGMYLRDLKQLPVPVPPLRQQDLIVDAVQAIEAKRASALAHSANARKAIERFRQAVLAAACSGRLTADWRASNGTNLAAEPAGEMPGTWKLVSLGELARSIRGGSTEVPANEPSDYPILRSSSVRPFRVDYNDTRFLSANQSQREDNFLQDGDLLITRLSGSIEYVGNCAIVESLEERRIQYPDRLFCCRLKNTSDSPYVEMFFAGPMMRKQIEDASRSAAGHQRISISDLKGFAIARPPHNEQLEIVRRVDQLLRFADAFLIRIDAATLRVERSSQAVLAKAFRGELLVPNSHIAPKEA